ncbi:MAG: GNAT family N-acetyltransferase [Taibaiella sp.]|jgi:hypothetical protein
MIIQQHLNSVDPYIVASWIKGWTIARGTSPPIPDHGGFRVDVAWPEQKVRYVFPYPSEGFQHLANTITDSWIYLKVCASPEIIKHFLPPRWIIQPLGFMMVCSQLINPLSAGLPDGYSLDITEALPVSTVKILTLDQQLVAIGHLSFVDDFAIYDRIETKPGFRRRGFGSIIMHALGVIANTYGREKGILVATAEGKTLYETLGWETYTLYTSAVIPLL